MYRRRRALVASVLVVGIWLAVSALGSLTASSQGSPAGASAASGAPAAATHVVRSGETLWSIASGLHAGGDVRDSVDALAEANDVEVIVPGQVLIIPADLRR
jgi:LysM repeat protein